MTRDDPTFERLIDANLNRLREGLRVLEDVNRFLHDDSSLSISFKHLRHQIQPAYSTARLSHRDIVHDVQKESTVSEMARNSVEGLMIANFARAEESARVLEETFKLINGELSALFKQVRYTLYDLEKRYFAQWSS